MLMHITWYGVDNRYISQYLPRERGQYCPQCEVWFEQTRHDAQVCWQVELLTQGLVVRPSIIEDMMKWDSQNFTSSCEQLSRVT